MPTYEYRCTKGHTFEVRQSITDEPLTRCTECRSKVQRVFHPVAVHFKGSGFYTTDYGKKGKRPESASNGTSSEGTSSEGTSSEKSAKKDKPKKEKTAKD